MLHVRKATSADYVAIERLLTRVNLPLVGVREPWVHFWLVEQLVGKERRLSRSGRKSEGHSIGRRAPLVGMVGMEVHTPYGLLRSFVWQQTSWQSTATEKMMQLLLQQAVRLQLTHVYLLTGMAAHWLQKLGFTPLAHTALPKTIRSLEHVVRTGQKGLPMVYAC